MLIPLVFNVLLAYASQFAALSVEFEFAFCTVLVAAVAFLLVVSWLMSVDAG